MASRRFVTRGLDRRKERVGILRFLNVGVAWNVEIVRVKGSDSGVWLTLVELGRKVKDSWW